MTTYVFFEIIVLQILFVSCSSNKTLVDKINTHYGKVNFTTKVKKTTFNIFMLRLIVQDFEVIMNSILIKLQKLVKFQNK